MAHRPHSRGFTLLECAISLVLVAGLLAVLVPTLSNARQTAHREQCANHQRVIGGAWEAYVADHNGEFPVIADQPGWMYAGMRFSSADGLAFPDPNRPLNVYLSLPRTREYENVVCCCPADRGITDPTEGLGTGSRTAFRSFGTSYRANSALLGLGNAIENPSGGVQRSAIVTAPSRMLVMGDPVWYERAEETDLTADWHGVAGAGNMLFLDGSVRFQPVRPRRTVGPIVFDPQFGLIGGLTDSESEADDQRGEASQP